ncbi:MAG: alkaline phosphatase family protein [Chitinispirillaceae bacterium]|nr:alkaline phosphatase family protein [Chitinispirillaceae bacterium]
MEKSVIFIFLDGFGLGEECETNPLALYGIPALESRLHTKLIAGTNNTSGNCHFAGIDAILGIEGIPQSATGQTSLLTGKNAQAFLGYHLPAFPDSRLVSIIQKYSILKTLTYAGLRATFANAYTETYFKKTDVSYSVTTHCVKAAGIPFRMISELLNNNAVYWDITRTSLKGKTDPAPEPIDPFEAGTHLARIARENDFVLFECFESDLIGHACDMDAAKQFLLKLDRFLEGVFSSREENTSVMICSDHGNIENCSKGSHTENPVPLISIGPASASLKHVLAIDQVTPAIINYLCS